MPKWWTKWPRQKMNESKVWMGKLFYILNDCSIASKSATFVSGCSNQNMDHNTYTLYVHIPGPRTQYLVIAIGSACHILVYN